MSPRFVMLRTRIHSYWWGLIMLLMSGAALSGCQAVLGSTLPTAYPTELFPTVIAMTVDARLALTQTSTHLYSPIDANPTPEPTRTGIANPPTATSPDGSLAPSQGPAPSRTPRPTASPTSLAATSTQTSRPPTPTRTPTRTPDLPVAHIQVFRPGPASRVTSPFKVSAYLIPGARGNVRMELIGEDGRLLVRKILPFGTPETARVWANTELAFEIEAVAEAARLVISTEDAEGRLISLASVDLILLTFGDEDITPAGEQKERIVLREPVKNMLIQGGNVIVSGLALPFGEDPLLVELHAANGKYVGPSRLVAVPASPDGSYTPFSVEVPYNVTTPTWVRVTVSQRDYRIPTLLHLVSVEVLISP